MAKNSKKPTVKKSAAKAPPAKASAKSAAASTKGKPAAKVKAAGKAPAKPVTNTKALAKPAVVAKSHAKTAVTDKGSTKSAPTTKSSATANAAPKSAGKAAVSAKPAATAKPTATVKPAAPAKPAATAKPAAAATPAMPAPAKLGLKSDLPAKFAKQLLANQEKALKNGTGKPAPVKRSSKPTRPAEVIAPPVVIPKPKNGKNAAGLSNKELELFRDLLLAKRRELVGDMYSMEREALQRSGENLSNLPVHMADMGTDNYEQEFTLGLMEKDRQLLREINQALAKIVDGTYGICEATGKIITKARLEVQPWAKFSIEHARKLENRGVYR